MKVLIGVDPHKASVAVAVVDEATGELVERASFPQNRDGLRALENALGDTVPRASLGGGERWRPRSSPGREAGSGRRVGGGRTAQALGTSAGALDRQRPQERWARCPRPRVGRFAQRAAGNGRSRGRLGSALRLLSERREEDLVTERTRALNRLHGLLRDLVPGGVTGKLSTLRAARILRGIRSQGASARLRRQLASEILRDIRTLQRKIADLDGRIEAEVEASGTTLTEIFGVGPILAAKIIGAVGNVVRFPTKAHFASYSGTAPMEASSGEVVRHRLSLAGNRKLNNALHMIARLCQARSDIRGGAYYYRKKIAEGKSLARKRCGASRGASRMPSSRALWQICRRLRAAPLDKEEPRTPLVRSSVCRARAHSR
jgi:transposase